MNNPLRILAGVIVCSVTLPIFLSVASYDDIETNTPQKQEQLIEKKIILKIYKLRNGR